MLSNETALLAPLPGRIVPLDQLPDPMFALGMMGDGLAIEPASGELKAPCDGEVVYVHRRGHAVKLRTAAGAEILVHVGLEAVALRGEGFTVLVQEGQEVTAGTPLLTFDPAALTALCGQITTPVLVTNEAAFHVENRLHDGAVAAGERIMLVAPIGVAHEPPKTRAERKVVLEMAQGLHARPAALLAAAAKNFTSAVEIGLGDRRANAKSPVSLLTLDSRHGSQLLIVAEGADAMQAVDAVAEAIASGLGDPIVPVGTLPAVDPEAAAVTEAARPPYRRSDRVDLKGVTAAPGLAIGRAFRLAGRRERPVEAGNGIAAESGALMRAIDTVRQHLETQATTGRTAQQRDIMRAHGALLDDSELQDAARKAITEGKSAGWAWSHAISSQTAILRGLDNARLAERADDLVDLEQQVLTVLAGGSIESPDLPADAVVVAEDLLPSQFMAFGDHLPAGIVVARGGRTSHVAILAASSGVPMLAAVGADALRIPDGMPLVLDAEHAKVAVNPSPADIAATRQAAERREVRREANLKAALQDCVMADGTKLAVYANVGSVADAARGVAFGAEGSGLLRTEFLFLERREAPNEAEQLAEYQAMADALRGLPLTIRTLDVGGDKPIAYLAQAPEENPILGVRGIRVSRCHPDLLRQQFRAILRVTPVTQCRIMLPMICDLGELRWARSVFEEEKAALGITAKVPLGIMIEVPAAVAMADRLAAEADFFSIGTNDLTQYVLAMDRGNTALAADIDALHPAVLRFIAQTAEGAHLYDRPVGVCGGLASEILAAPILIGLGITSLSATRSTIPELKAFIRTLDMSSCQEIAREALRQDSAEAVRALVGGRWPDV